MNKALRFRLYPNREQEGLMKKTFGCCRFIYNRMLADQKEAYEKDKSCPKLTPAMYKGEFLWLKEVDSLALANEQLHLQSAYQKFFADPKTGFPRFKSKHRDRDSYTTNLVNGNIVLDGNRLKLPKLTPVRIVAHREIPEEWKLKSVTVVREPSGKYYASILYSYENQVEEQKEAERFLGIDFAMHGLAVFPDGSSADYPGYYKEAQVRLAREQRRLSHCEKGSRNYVKQRRRVAVFHEKIRHQRNDFQHKLSYRLAEEYDCICIEDLNLKGMSRGLHLGQGVADNGYGAFVEKLEYKLKDRGKKLIRVDRFYPSSKKCSCCGRIRKELKLSERIYCCECGNQMDRDQNAAINLCEEGKRLYQELRKSA